MLGTVVVEASVVEVSPGRDVDVVVEATVVDVSATVVSVDAVVDVSATDVSVALVDDVVTSDACVPMNGPRSVFDEAQAAPPETNAMATTEATLNARSLPSTTFPLGSDHRRTVVSTRSAPDLNSPRHRSRTRHAPTIAGGSGVGKSDAFSAVEVRPNVR